MKRIFILLSFSLLGGVITFLGGLAGKVEFSAVITRSLVAVLIGMLVSLGLLFLVSKYLFPDSDLFQIQDSDSQSSSKKSAVQKKAAELHKPGVGSQAEQRDRTPEDQLIAADGRHDNPFDASELELKISREAQEQALEDRNSAEGQLRNTDSKELANLVRHSITEEL